MSFFSKLVKPYRKGERNFDRGRQAEFRRDFSAANTYFQKAAEAWDEHFSGKDIEDARPSHLVMAGICYTRTGRYQDALHMFDQCLKIKDIPDAWLHAGYSAAKLGDAGQTVAYWEKYSAEAGQRVIANALKEQLKIISSQETPDLQAVCEAVAEAVFRQDIENHRNAKFGPHQYKKAHPANRGY